MSSGFFGTPAIDFLPGVPAEHVLERLRSAGGKEIESGKFASEQSSAALAVNTFGWFVPRPRLVPPIPGLTMIGMPTRVEVEYRARFPWAGGRHPWLDAMIESSTHLVGVESKRFEPFRDRKSVSLSEAYDQPVWGDQMAPFERMRDALRNEKVVFECLDAAQLVKHAFGLVTDARRHERKPALFYLYAEPEQVRERDLKRHRREIAAFAEAVAAAEVSFSAASYRDWLTGWQECGPDVSSHGRAIVERFRP
jgi:hypothetical protein